MSNSNDEWREIRRDGNRAGRYAIVWILIAVALIAAISAGLWALNVATSSARGQGDAYAQKNSAQNWTEAQARFEEMYQEVISADQRITLAATALAANPDDKTLQQNLTGIQAHCIEATADYNAEARKYLSEDFRAADLPDQINTTNTTTDCKE